MENVIQQKVRSDLALGRIAAVPSKAAHPLVLALLFPLVFIVCDILLKALLEVGGVQHLTLLECVLLTSSASPPSP